MSASRWLNWRPKEQKFDESARSEPTKPTKPPEAAEIFRESAGSEPTKPTKPPRQEQGEAALTFVNRAAARLVRTESSPSARVVIEVPSVNDTPEFRAALKVLRLDHIPVVLRDMPLGLRPEIEHGRSGQR